MTAPIYAVILNLITFLGRHSRRMLTAGLVLVSFTILGFLIVRDWGTLREFQWQIKPFMLLIALCCHAISLAGTFVAWRMIMNHLGSPVGARTDFHIYFLSLAARKIPSAIWYAGARLLLYVQEGVNASLVLSAIAQELGISILTGCWTFVAFRAYYLFMEGYEWVGHGILVLTLLLTALLIAQPNLFIQWIQHRRVGQSNHFLSISVFERRCLLICSAIYLGAWIVGGTSFYLTIHALIPNPEINWPNAVGVATVSTLVVLVSTILPMGIGMKELTAGVLLGIWLPVPVGLAVAVAYRILQVFDEALWVGLAYLLRPKALEQKHLV